MANNDGGPAFPRPKWWPTDGDPDLGVLPQGGMSLRDYFAAQAIAAVMAARVALVNADLGNDLNQESIAEECYELADALLEAREKSQFEPVGAEPDIRD